MSRTYRCRLPFVFRRHHGIYVSSRTRGGVRGSVVGSVHVYDTTLGLEDLSDPVWEWDGDTVESVRGRDPSQRRRRLTSWRDRLEPTRFLGFLELWIQVDVEKRRTTNEVTGVSPEYILNWYEERPTTVTPFYFTVPKWKILSRLSGSLWSGIFLWSTTVSIIGLPVRTSLLLGFLYAVTGGSSPSSLNFTLSPSNWNTLLLFLLYEPVYVQILTTRLKTWKFKLF